MPEAAAPPTPPSEPAQGRLIAFEFTVFSEGGEELGSSVGGNPRIFEVGTGEVLPAVEKALVEMDEDESRSIVLSPENAYGPVRSDAIREFPLESIPEEARHVGRKVVGRAPDGAEDTFDVVGIEGDKVLVDMNHPLAGQTLRFEVRLLRDGLTRG